jgi:hypothetical protein
MHSDAIILCKCRKAFTVDFNLPPFYFMKERDSELFMGICGLLIIVILGGKSVGIMSNTH